MPLATRLFEDQRRAAREANRAQGGGIVGEALSFDAPDDAAAAEVVLALSKEVPMGSTYRIVWRV